MFAKTARSVLAFGVVFVAYQLYALAVVPLLTPRGVRAVGGAAMAAAPESPDAVARYQELLRSYFPEDHWSIAGKPKVFESGPVMLVFDDYRRDDRGRVDLLKCAVVMFPTPREDGAEPPRDAVVLEAPGGARLQFDQEFNPSRGRVGDVVAGVFPGPITVRSDMKEKGPDDDLLIETHDVRMNESLIFTPHEVNVRLGRSHGSGRRLEIKLMEEEYSRPGDSGLSVAGVEYLELFEDVELTLHLGKLRLDGSRFAAAPRPRRSSVRPAAFQSDGEAAMWADDGDGHSAYEQAEREEPAAQPLIVTCAGSFRMDFVDFTATFNEHVWARQLNLSGQSDQLFCKTLKLRMAGGDGRRLSLRDDPDFTSRQAHALGDLRLTMLEATGDPVKLDSPSRDASARGQSLRLDLERRRITLDGGRAVLVQGPNEARAPVISYEHPPDDDPAAVGRLWMAGPGSVRITPNESRPEEVIEAQWNAAPGVDFPVQLVRVNGRPVLMVEGRPRVSSSVLGRITSDRLRVALREVPADGKDGPAIELGGGEDEPRALLAERIDAVGVVQVEAPELAARTNELTVWVRPLSGGEDDARPEAAGESRVSPSDSRQPPRKRYSLVAHQMHMDLLLEGRRGVPANLVCEGAVRFSEVAGERAEEPLVVSGERMKVTDLRTGDVKVLVEGAAGDASSLAEIDARGLALRAARVNLDQAAGRMWADGAGDARVSIERDLFGQPTVAATDLYLRWQGGLTFDGRRITVREDVFGEGPHDWLRCERMVATLTRPVDFKEARGDTDVEVAQVECSGGVTIDHRTVDEQGQRSHERMRLEETISINQSTGAMSGTGPGWVRSVHLSDAAGGLGALPGAAPREPDNDEDDGPRLHFLRVQFLNGLDGDLNTRRVAFHGDVRAVYGPVLAWEQELPMEFPGGLPPETATLQSDHLQVNEDPMARATASRGPAGERLNTMELKAWGNARLEASAGESGVFTAHAATVSYSQTKEIFQIQGDGRKPATIWRRAAPGAPPDRAVMKTFSFNRKTGRVVVSDFYNVSSEFGASSASAPRSSGARGARR